MTDTQGVPVASVINMSLQYSGDTSQDVADLRSATDSAVDRNFLLVAASGNDFSGLPNRINYYPGVLWNVMAVAATASNDRSTYYSIAGGRISVGAPAG